MVNCAHPSHFARRASQGGGAWLGRIAGLRANASTMSHAELDEAEELDEGDPAELGADYAALRTRLRNVNVLGGCCGTDERHVAAVAAAWHELSGSSQRSSSRRAIARRGGSSSALAPGSAGRAGAPAVDVVGGRGGDLGAAEPAHVLDRRPRAGAARPRPRAPRSRASATTGTATAARRRSAAGRPRTPLSSATSRATASSRLSPGSTKPASAE